MRRAAVRAWVWLERHPRRALLLAVAAVWLIRIPFLFRPLEADEGGFLMVAHQWNGGGTSLYGDQWVDRPPLLLLTFKVAAAWGGTSVVVHLFAAAFNTLLVCAAWWAGRVVNDAKGAVAAAVVAAFAGANITIGGQALTGELIAGSIVLVSCALILQAVYRAPSAQTGMLLALLAGIAAVLAFLVKQNFIDAGIFGVALLAFRPSRTWRMMVAFVAGVAIPLFVTAVWAISDAGPGVLRLWRALFRFRQRAFDVVSQSDSVAPFLRLRMLVLLFVASGLVFLSWQLVVACLRVAGDRNLRVAVFVMWAYGVIGILVGASWWRHYLLALIPALAIGTALATRREARRLRTHYAATFTAAATVVASVVGIVLLVSGPMPKEDEQEVAAYLRDASAPDDGIFVAYGAPNVIWWSGLDAPYRYSWSLPMRGRDPHLTQLVETLEGPNAPQWIVEVGDFDWWGIDTRAFRQVRGTDYHVVARVCGHDIYLRNDVTRDRPPIPTC